MTRQLSPKLGLLSAQILLWPGSGQTKPPSVVLRVSPALALVEGESLSLACLVHPSPPAPPPTYSIQRDNLTVSTGSQAVLISVVTKSHSGRYRCSVTDHTGAVRHSGEVHVTVEEGVPKPTLWAEPAGGEVASGDSVTLTCQLPGRPGWSFYWHKDRQGAEPVAQVRASAGGGSRAVYRQWRASPTHTGQYWCRAGRGQPAFYTHYSQPVYVNVTAEPFASVTLAASPSSTIKEGGALNLTCHARRSTRRDHNRNRTAAAVVRFSFLKDGWPVVRDSGRGVYSVARAFARHAGRYRCVASAGAARATSQEVLISLVNPSLLLVHCVGSLLLVSVAPLAFALRHYGVRRKAAASEKAESQMEPLYSS